MAISNYTELKSSIASYLARSDLTNVIPDFIGLSEAKLKRRFRDVTTLSDGNTSNWLLTNHPDVYLYGALLEAQPYLMDDARIATWAQIFERVVAEVRLPNVNANLANYAGLQLAISDWLARPDLDNAIPNFIRLAEAKLQRKFVDVTTLTSQNTTNWLLTSHPDVYLYASLVEATPYIKDDPRLPVWLDNYNTRVAEVRRPSTSANFTNYSGLKALVADWLNRPDLTNAIPNFIRLAENRLRRDLRIREMLKVATANTTAGDSTVSVPSDFLELRDLHFDGNPTSTITYLSPSAFFRNSRTSESGIPTFYTILANEFQFAPIPDSSYTARILYYSAPTYLSDQNASNNFLAYCPDALLYSTLLEAEPYLINDARVQIWASLYERAISAISESDDRSEYSSVPMVISVATR